jgi:hypothetical protein
MPPIECKTLIWAANNLISDDDLLETFGGGIDKINSLVEYFMVTPEIVNLRLELFEKPVY